MKDHITIKINNIVIDQKEFIKYLGVLMDSTLSWKFHISNISKKISRPLLPLKVMKNVFLKSLKSYYVSEYE